MFNKEVSIKTTSDKNGSKKEPNRIKRLLLIIFSSFFFLLILGLTSYLFYEKITNKSLSNINISEVNKDVVFAKFKSEEDFKNYLSQSNFSFTYPSMGISGAIPGFSKQEIDLGAPVAMENLDTSPDRVSDTNVQVIGIDEPDIIKISGNNIIFSSTQNTFNYPIDYDVGTRTQSVTITPKSNIKIINAFPIENLSALAQIEDFGNLLIKNNTLIVFSGNDLVAYDIKIPEMPQKKWEIDFDEQNTLVSSRLYEDSIYLITKKQFNRANPCPISLSTKNSIAIGCNEVFHPNFITNSDSTTSILKINAESGKVLDTLTFTTASGSNIFYMSDNNIYITYPDKINIAKVYYQILEREASDLLPKETMQRLKTISSYDISEYSQTLELSITLENYFNSLSNDESKRIQNELNNRLENSSIEYLRNIFNTIILKINNDKLSINSTGKVPGYPLSQFSLDEYQGYFRIATTINANNASGFLMSSKSFNDLYILDENMSITGDILNLGEGEQIYAVRFLDNRGYVVTYKQIDPFYVLDLADSKNPKKKGELKIPGFSSYLHPLDKNLILGIGKEDAKVKISLFDVENPQNPQEIDKYQLDEYWTDITNDHHAFLLDEKNKIFFIPSGNDGYIFSYKKNVIQLEKVVTGIQAKRSAFIDNYLYVIGNDKIVVFDESSFDEINSLIL